MATTKKKNDPNIKRKQGGLITMPFIFGNEVGEKLAVVGFSTNMISYLTGQLHLPMTKAANTLTNFGDTGAFIADAFAGRFWTITVASVLLQLGMISLTVSAILPNLRPPPCKGGEACAEADSGQLAVLYISLLLSALGSGGYRPCILSFGADQFDENDAKEKVTKWKFFNWFLDKAAMVTEDDDPKAPNPWRLSTIHRVEELKSLLRMGPIWAAGIITITAAAQQNTFSLQQARSMDRHLSRSFQIPPASMSVFTQTSMLATIVFYDRLFVPSPAASPASTAASPSSPGSGSASASPSSPRSPPASSRSAARTPRRRTASRASPAPPSRSPSSGWRRSTDSMAWRRRSRRSATSSSSTTKRRRACGAPRRRSSGSPSPPGATPARCSSRWCTSTARRLMGRTGCPMIISIEASWSICIGSLRFCSS